MLQDFKFLGFEENIILKLLLIIPLSVNIYHNIMTAKYEECEAYKGAKWVDTKM